MGGISLHIFLGLSVLHDLSISLWSKSIHRFARIGIGGVGFFSWFQSVTGDESPVGAFGNFGTAVAEDGGNREEGAFHLGKVWDVILILINYTPHPRTAAFYCFFFALTPWFGCTMSLHITWRKQCKVKSHEESSGRSGPGVPLNGDHPGARCWCRGGEYPGNA